MRLAELLRLAEESPRVRVTRTTGVVTLSAYPEHVEVYDNTSRAVYDQSLVSARKLTVTAAANLLGLL